MNSSFLHSSEPTTMPMPPGYQSGYWTGVEDAESVAASHADEESTRFQDASGNIQPIKRLFKNRFEIIRRLGRGGFSTTYLAQDITADRPFLCVIKHLKKRVKAGQPKTILQLERMTRRFQREARMMARLGRNHQLPCLLDHFVDDDQFYLVQEHVPGLTLNQDLKRTGPKTEAQVKAFLCEMIPVIRYVHRQRLLHLDIKPSNIILRDSDQKLVLIDFGAVRRYPPDGLVNQDSERCVGTIGFSPMEQLLGEPAYASDIYALGVTCLYLLTATSPLDFAIAPKGQNLRWQESVQLSPHFASMLEKMLSPDLSRRFQNIEDLDRTMKLETHYADLKDCMTTDPLKDNTFKGPKACSLGAAKTGQAQSHAERQAASIRRWQQRRRQFKAFVPK